jgi:hypothetical protein
VESVQGARGGSGRSSGASLRARGGVAVAAAQRRRYGARGRAAAAAAARRHGLAAVGPWGGVGRGRTHTLRFTRRHARLEFSSAARCAAGRALAAAGPQGVCAQIYRAKAAEAVMRARSHSPPVVWRLPREHKRCALRFSAQTCGGGTGEASRAVTSAHAGVRATLRCVARFAGLEDFRTSLSLASRIAGRER